MGAFSGETKHSCARDLNILYVQILQAMALEIVFIWSSMDFALFCQWGIVSFIIHSIYGMIMMFWGLSYIPYVI